jgi:hypothetical protein
MNRRDRKRNYAAAFFEVFTCRNVVPAPLGQLFAAPGQDKKGQKPLIPP